MFLALAALTYEVSGILRAGRYEQLQTAGEPLAFRNKTGRGYRGVDIVLAVSGTGRERSLAAAKWAISEYKPDAVISMGFGGGTKPSLQPGHVVLATEMHRLDGAPFYWDKRQFGEPICPDRTLLARARNAVELAGVDFELGRLVNLPVIAKTSGMKRWIGKSLLASAIDMESYVVAEAALEAGVPFVAVRAIVDTCDVDLPGLVGEVDQPPGRGMALAALRYVLRNPMQTPALARLARHSAHARRSLTSFFSEYVAEQGYAARMASDITQKAVSGRMA
ncbi:MAG: hypothetical protein WD208_04070 [Dehalococcoidia bacterium]